MARHPGRPWGRPLPEEVRRYYLDGKPESLLQDVLNHYQHNVWPIAEAIIRARINNAYDASVVIEGSAILPACTSTLESAKVYAFWFTAPNQLISARIRQSSQYDEQTPDVRHMIDCFLNRSQLFNDWLKDSLSQSGFRAIDVGLPNSQPTLLSELVEAIS